MQREEWQPQIEQCLWDADCGAEVAKWASGHPEWRVPADKVHLLPEVEEGNKGSGGSGHGIPIKAWAYNGVHELCNAREYFWMEGTLTGWKPISEPKQAPKRKRGKKHER